MRDLSALFEPPFPPRDYDSWLLDFKAFLKDRPVTTEEVRDAVLGMDRSLGRCTESLYRGGNISGCLVAARGPVATYAFTREEEAYDLLAGFVASTAHALGQSEGGPFLDALPSAVSAVKALKPEWFADDWSPPVEAVRMLSSSVPDGWRLVAEPYGVMDEGTLHALVPMDWQDTDMLPWNMGDQANRAFVSPDGEYMWVEWFGTLSAR